MKEITTSQDWESILSTSDNTPFFLFKHSTACPVSAFARNRVDTYLAQRNESAPPFIMVKVIESRSLSNAIAQELTITHQSPQLILVHNSHAVWNTSHNQITEDTITQALALLP